jgi:HD superfamily phosphohydrolase
MEILDPVHGHISISELEKPLVESPYIQRLRHIKQLTAADILYPGGVHTRFIHSLGTMWIGSKYAEHLYPGNKHIRQLVRICMLFHDCGHVVGSHAYDDTVYSVIYPGVRKGHDQQRFKVIQDKTLRKEIEATGITIEEIMDVWNGKNKVLSAICQGQLGADRLDFTKRDAYFCGVSHLGKICLERIIKNSSINVRNGVEELHYSIKIKDDVLAALTSRLNMYRNVYHHKTCNAAQIIYRKMLESSMYILDLPNRTKNLEQFKSLTDYVIGEILDKNSKSYDQLTEARKYAMILVSRQGLPKMVWEKVVEHTKDNHMVIKKEMDLYVKENDIKNAIIDEIIDIKYIDGDTIYFMDKDGVSYNLVDITQKGQYEYYNISLMNYSIYRIYVMD